jgi:hypothetical protein
LRLASKGGLIDETLAELTGFGFKPELKRESYEAIAKGGFNRATLGAAFVLTQLALECQPITVRGLMYRAQAAGLFPSTSLRYYQQTARVVLKLRRSGLVPYRWIVDSTRRRLKPSSWSGLGDFAEDAARAYRLDFWSRQADYLEFFCEKDAMSAVIEPVTHEFDVHLNVIRGQVSETFVWNIAKEWKEIEKPIYAYYLGDHDPSGLKIEASLKSKLSHFAEKDFEWERLAITPEDFASDLLGFPVKRSGSWRDYLAQYGDRCVEVDALPPDEIRERVRQAIEHHIDHDEWWRLRETERLERETLESTLRRLDGEDHQAASAISENGENDDDFPIPF